MFQIPVLLIFLIIIGAGLFDVQQGGQEYRDIADVDDMVGCHHLHLRFSWKNMVHDVSMRRDTGLDWASDKYEQGLKGLLTPRKVPISERVWHDMEMS